ncbi:MAG: hypothetical protein Q9161_002677 [Pseudevernia consocians]
MEDRPHNSWEALLVQKQPVRVLVIVRKLNKFFECSDASIKEIALQHLHEEDANAKTLVIAKWPSVTTMVFDLFNHGYDFQKGHEADVMDLIAIDLGPKNPKITKMSDLKKREVNASIAEYHTLNGFEVQPPFLEDHRNGNVPAYLNPRS